MLAILEGSRMPSIYTIGVEFFLQVIQMMSLNNSFKNKKK